MSIDVKRQTAESEVTQHSVLFNSVTSERRSFEGCSMNASIRECEALGKGGNECEGRRSSLAFDSSVDSHGENVISTATGDSL